MDVQAMHIANGIINGSVSAIFLVVAVAGLAVCVWRAKLDLDDRLAPMAGLVAAFIFAVQMLNFPVAAGTSGHLLGGVLAAVLVGPWAGSICVAVVLLVQALLFADGGLTALGPNIVNMAIVTAFGGYALFTLLRRLLPSNTAGVVIASGVSATLAVVLASIAFTIEYAIGGTGSAPIGTVAAAMIGVHLLIGIGEGVITALTVSAVLAARPDLVYGARNLAPALQLRGSTAGSVRSS